MQYFFKHSQATNVSESVELVNVSLYNGNQATSYTTNAYYSAPQTTFSNERPLQEIVTSGPFDFIQESQIDATHGIKAILFSHCSQFCVLKTRFIKFIFNLNFNFFLVF